jgi:hypothetical protein
VGVGSGRGRYPYPWYHSTSGESGIEIANRASGLTMSKTLQNLKENMDAGKIKLSPEDVQAVRDVADTANAAQGDRYPEAYMKSLFADTPLP